MFLFGIPHSETVKVTEFELQWNYYIHFKTNAL